MNKRTSHFTALASGVLLLALIVPIHVTHAAWWDVGGNIIGAIVAPLALMVLKLTSLLNMLAGVLLNYVVKFTIVDMAEHYSNLTAINSTWTLVRDLANMCFIFVLLYASIQTILGIGKDVRGLIVKIVIAALLMNFSLFFTKIIIDLANLIALTFYHAIAPGAASDAAGLNAGLSNSLMQPLNLQTIWDFNEVKLSGSTLAIIGVMGSMMTLIASFIFFAVSIMLIIRYVVLVMVLILSPIAVLAHILPQMKGIAKKWWDALLNQAFFAPAYMAMTWITISIFENLVQSKGTVVKALTGTVTKNSAGQDVVNFSGGSIDVLFNFTIVIAFLVASLMIAKSISNKAGMGMSKLTSSALGFAGGASFGMAAKFGRGTVGKAGLALSESQFLRDRPDSRMARLAMATSKKAGSASFDGRGTALGGSLQAGSASGKGGARASREQTVKDRMAQAQDFRDIVTGDHVEDEMSNRRWNTDADRARLQALGLTPAQIASINANGLSKNQVRELGLDARQTEAIRRGVQSDLIAGSDRETARRQELFLHSLSQTTFGLPNMYSGVSDDAEAARRMRAGQRTYETPAHETNALLQSLLAQQQAVVNPGVTGQPGGNPGPTNTPGVGTPPPGGAPNQQNPGQPNPGGTQTGTPGGLGGANARRRAQQQAQRNRGNTNNPSQTPPPGGTPTPPPTTP